MKIIFIACIMMICCACKNRQPETPASQDTTVFVVADTVKHTSDSLPAISVSTTPVDSTRNVELIIEKGELIYVSRNEFSYISNPYDFYLEATVIADLLGDGVKTKVQEFEAGEDHSAYTYTTMTYKDTEISFYDYPGKHVSTITTARLPLKNGVLIGMHKSDFATAMGYSGAAKATVFRLLDDYGEMEFLFRSDTLYQVYARYEEGD